MSDNDDVIEKIKDIQRRVDSFRNLDPTDIMIQYEKIYPEFEKLQKALTDEIQGKGGFEQEDIIKMMSFNKIQLDTKIELHHAFIKKLVKDVAELKKKK